jgi:chemotaxis protein MotB
MQRDRIKPNFFHEYVKEEVEEELWLVSYADMVTLLFGFFVILFSFSRLDDEKFDQLTEKVAEAFSADKKKQEGVSSVGVSSEERQLRAMQMLLTMFDLGSSNDEESIQKIEKKYAEYQQDKGTKNHLQEKFKTEKQEDVIDSGQKDLYHQVEIVLPETSLFASSSFVLNTVAISQLKTLAQDLMTIPGLELIEVTGHTDRRPIRLRTSVTNNFTLSSLRAGAVAEIFLNAGIEPKKISVRGMARTSSKQC